MNVNGNLVEENVIQMNGGLTLNLDVSVNIFMYGKKIMFGILLNVTAKMEKNWQVLWIKLFVMKLWT